MAVRHRIERHNFARFPLQIDEQIDPRADQPIPVEIRAAVTHKSRGFALFSSVPSETTVFVTSECGFPQIAQILGVSEVKERSFFSIWQKSGLLRSILPTVLD